MGLDVSLVTLGALVLVAFASGWVDAVVGGGGLIQLPSLLIGLPASTPVAVVSGTNKLSSVAGTAMATGTFLRKIRVALPQAAVLVATAGAGSMIGAQLVHFLPKRYFTPLVLVVLIGVGFYTWRRPQLGLAHRERLTGARRLVATGVIGLVLGTYDGFIGPGTGTFFIVAFVTVLGYGFLHASAYAKLANLTTNLAAIVVFALHGQLLLGVGLAMAAANLTGGLVGARLAIKHGNGFVRTVFLIVVAALIVKLSYDTVILALNGFR